MFNHFVWWSFKNWLHLSFHKYFFFLKIYLNVMNIISIFIEKQYSIVVKTTDFGSRVPGFQCCVSISYIVCYHWFKFVILKVIYYTRLQILLRSSISPCKMAPKCYVFLIFMCSFCLPLLFLAVTSHFFCTSSNSIAAIFLSSHDIFLISCDLGNRQLNLFEVYILLKMDSKWMPKGFSS